MDDQHAYEATTFTSLPHAFIKLTFIEDHQKFYTLKEKITGRKYFVWNVPKSKNIQATWNGKKYFTGDSEHIFAFTFFTYYIFHSINCFKGNKLTYLIDKNAYFLLYTFKRYKIKIPMKIIS